MTAKIFHHSIPFFISLFFCMSLTAQTWELVQQFGNNGGESCQALVTDLQDNIYISGGFDANFELGNTELSPVGDIDIYLSKLGENGEVQWAVSGGSIEDDEVSEIAIDSENNVYWTGMYWLDADFGDTTLSVESSSRAIFIIKYNTDGALLWAKSFDGTGLKQVSDIAIDDNNDMYLTGYFENTLTLDDWTLTAIGDTDMFVAKMTADGEMIWANRLGLEGETLGISLAVDSGKNVVIGGHYEGEIAFMEDTIQSNTPDFDVFVCKFAANGEVLWGRKAGGVFPSENTEIAVADTDNIYVTGTFLGVLKLTEEIELQTSGFNKNIYLLHYDQDGTPLWAKSIGGLEDEEVKDMVLQNQTIAMSGNFVGQMMVDDLSITHDATIFNGFVAGFSLDGDAKWLEKMTASELLLGEEVFINRESQVLTAGIFTETATFSPGNYPSNGSFDVFLARLNQEITPVKNVKKNTPIFSIFPNPTTEYLFIKTDEPTFVLKIIDVHGLVVKEFETTRFVNVNDLDTGIYYVLMETNDGRFIKKLIIF